MSRATAITVHGGGRDRRARLVGCPFGKTKKIIQGISP